MKTVMFVFAVLVSGEAFAQSLDDALKNAISNSDQEKLSQQQNLNVSDSQIISSLKRVKKTEIFEIRQEDSEAVVQSPGSISAEERAPAAVVDDLAYLNE